MFKSILSFIIITSFGASSFGQNIRVTEEKENSLKKGMFAVQIGVGSNFTLGSFQDFTAAAKYHFSNRIALRLSASYDYHHFEGRQYIYEYTPDSNYVYFPDVGVVESYNTQLQFIYYLKSKSDINVYLGIGPRVSYAYDLRRDNIESYYNLQDSYYNVIRNKSWSIGGSASLGFEWFPFKSLSLTAEYFAYAQKGKTDYELSRYNFDGTRTKQYTNDYDTKDLYWKNAFLGLTLYFSL